jgi:hypothetical protein
VLHACATAEGRSNRDAATVLTDASLAGWPAMSQFGNAIFVITAMAVVVLVMGWRP